MATASEYPTVGALVWRLSMKWKAALDRALAPLDLTHAQYSLLSSLFGMEQDGSPPSQRELADRTGLEALYVSKLARTLEAGGLLARTRDPVDTRAVRLTLTERGDAVVREAMDIVWGFLDRNLAPLGGPDSPRTQVFRRELGALLDAPLAPPPHPKESP